MNMFLHIATYDLIVKMFKQYYLASVIVNIMVGYSHFSHTFKRPKHKSSFS